MINPVVEMFDEFNEDNSSMLNEDVYWLPDDGDVIYKPILKTCAVTDTINK